MTIKPMCLYCEIDSDRVPLLALHYQGENLWICSQHLPVLIHEPAKLVGKLAGAEGFTPAKGHGEAHG